MFIVWEVSWRLNKTATYWPPALLDIAAFLSRSAGLLNRGPGGPASTGSGSHSSNWNTDFKLWSPTNWLPVAAGLYHCLISTCFLWRHNSHSIPPVNSQGCPLISSTGCTCYLYWCISYLTAWPGRRSICYMRYWSESERNWVTGVWTHFLRCRSRSDSYCTMGIPSF